MDAAWRIRKINLDLIATTECLYNGTYLNVQNI
jgi:hypothetical protein